MFFNLFKKRKEKAICVPKRNCPKYGSIEGYVTTGKRLEPRDFYYGFDRIVLYNVKYRDILRRKGIDGLISALLKESPTLRTEQKALDYLRSRLPERVADYDIQCYHVWDTFKVFGRDIHGLREVQRRSELIAGEHFRDLDVFAPKAFQREEDGIHIGQMYQSYPTFDSYDAVDNRFYQNYIFRKSSITEQDMMALYAVPSEMNAQRVHERIPPNMLPLLYYPGDGGYMLLASPKG